jgi:transcriptional regulator with XRE-family HTH domain
MAKSVKSPDATDKGVGEKIRTQRLLRRISQTDLGNQVGITFQQIQKYEKGANRVGAGRLQRIAEVLGVPVSFFFEGAQGSSIEVENVNSSLRFLENAAAVRIVRAFAEIDNPRIRQAIVALVEGIAERQRSRKEKPQGND